ncbi:MAG TPA: hypothetical protein VIG99_21945 [Myxococcaceae bacterium]|jgi:hypothetical protein
MKAKPSFPDALAGAKPLPPKPCAGAGALASRSAAHATTAQALQRARASHAVEAHRLGEARKDHPAVPSPAFPRGVRERVMEALESAPPPPQVLPAAVPGHPSPSQADRAPTSRVESALQLVERIQVFLRSGRPQLELSVGGQLEAQVLLERTGPREVAVTVRGRNGPPPAQELARVREEMQRRGLKVSALEIG